MYLIIAGLLLFITISPPVQNQPRLHSDFKAHPSYTGRCCLKKNWSNSLIYFYIKMTEMSRWTKFYIAILSGDQFKVETLTPTNTHVKKKESRNILSEKICNIYMGSARELGFDLLESISINHLPNIRLYEWSFEAWEPEIAASHFMTNHEWWEMYLSRTPLWRKICHEKNVSMSLSIWSWFYSGVL